MLSPDDTPVATAKRLPGESEEERDSSGRLWRTVIIGDQEQRIDMQVIRPYLRVVTHGGEIQTRLMTEDTRPVWNKTLLHYHRNKEIE